MTSARTPYQDTSVPVERSKEQRERQAWRALSWYLKTMLEAATFGLLKFEDVFLSFFVGDNDLTIGEVLIPRLESGRLQLGAGE